MEIEISAFRILKNQDLWKRSGRDVTRDEALFIAASSE
jgi:hypothetical protein